MTYNEILNEVKSDTENYLLEDYKIERKKGKYFAVDNTGDTIEGTRGNGYMSLENAVRHMLSTTLGHAKFDSLSYVKKQEKIKKFINKFEKSKSTTRRKFGFDERKMEQ